MPFYAFVGIFALCGILGIFLLKPKSSSKTTVRTLDIITSKNKSGIELPGGSKTGGWQTLAERIGDYVERFHFAGDLRLLILHAGSKESVGSVVALSLLIAAVTSLIAHEWLGLLPVDLVALVVGGSVRLILLKIKKSRRMNKFNEVLPEAIDLLARALRAGHSIGSAVEIVAEQSAEPLAAEFGIVFQQQKFGIPFRDAVLDLGDRVPSKDLQFLITAILVQRETGGDLTEILDRTSHVIRDRVRIEGEIKTYTAQGRMTGWILGSMPAILLVAINFLSPGYSDVLFHDPLGHLLLGAGATLIVIGGLIIRKIVDIRV